MPSTQCRGSLALHRSDVRVWTTVDSTAAMFDLSVVSWICARDLCDEISELTPCLNELLRLFRCLAAGCQDCRAPKKHLAQGPWPALLQGSSRAWPEGNKNPLALSLAVQLKQREPHLGVLEFLNPGAWSSATSCRALASHLSHETRVPALTGTTAARLVLLSSQT